MFITNFPSNKRNNLKFQSVVAYPTWLYGRGANQGSLKKGRGTIGPSTLNNVYTCLFQYPDSKISIIYTGITLNLNFYFFADFRSEILDNKQLKLKIKSCSFHKKVLDLGNFYWFMITKQKIKKGAKLGIFTL